MIHDTKNVGKPTVLTCRFPTFYGCLLQIEVTMGPDYFKQPVISRAWDGFLRVSDFINTTFLPLLILFIIVFVLAWEFWHNNSQLVRSCIWFVAGLASMYALSFAPSEQETGRIYSGATIFIIIAICVLFPNSYSISNHSLKALCTMGSSILILIGAFNLISGFRDSTRSSQAINIRYSYIKKEKKKVGKGATLEVYPLAYLPQTKYSVNYPLTDVGPNPEKFPNKGYINNFGIKVFKK